MSQRLRNTILQILQRLLTLRGFQIIFTLAIPRVQKMAHISWESKGKYFSVGWLYHLDSIHLRALLGNVAAKDETPKAHKWPQISSKLPGYHSATSMLASVSTQRYSSPVTLGYGSSPTTSCAYIAAAGDMGKVPRTHGIPRSEHHHKPGKLPSTLSQLAEALSTNKGIEWVF